MTIELKVPTAGESITEVTIVEWLKEEGGWALQDETVAVIETDKANVELVAPTEGRITQILKAAGAVVRVDEVIGYMEAGAGEDAAQTVRPRSHSASSSEPQASKVVEVPKPSPPAALGFRASPSVRRALRAGDIDPKDLKPSGPALGKGQDTEGAVFRAETPASLAEEVVPMTPLRRRIAGRLVEAQQNAALLTTFNEVDMGAVMSLRRSYQEAFVKKYGVKLGFMSFFVRATVEALKSMPALNAEIRGTDIVYRNHYDIGVAVGGGRGLVVPVIRNAERLGFAEIEERIVDFAKRAKANSLKLEELQGGTFTISNGGVYGSLLSTPIVNPPQSGILGMHAIQERPVVKDGQVVVRKMMYLALTYDHRLVDGREAVGFLVRIKETIENPSRILLEV